MAETGKSLPPPNRRRDKPQLSCNLCRRRKLRCDRGHPCGSCRHRGLSLSCTYSPTGLAETRHITKDTRPPGHSGLTDRISQLERLISSFVEDPNAQKQAGQFDSSGLTGDVRVKEPRPSSSDSAPDPSDSFGHISLRDSKTKYVQDTHWTAILDGIAELKNSVNDEAARYSERSPPAYSSPEILFPSCEPASRSEILRELPSREGCDRLLSSYFKHTSLPLLHGPSFLRQYERFWETPQETHIMWVGKLFGTLSLALIFQGNVLGRYQDCPPDTIEAICGSLNIQFHQSGDGEISSLVILGVLVRMAQRMGYHRDASHFPHISPFHGEMRRRVWAIIKDLDVMLSLSAGLPRILREFQSDTAPPRNILDADFDEDLSELPPSRPESFPTPCQWLVAKNKLTSMLGIISDVVTSIRRPSYSEVMRLDKVLHETYASVPEHFHERPLHKSLMDTSETIIHRVQLVSLYSKARCLLHYRYLASARSDHRYAYSRDSCLEASLKILENQDMLFQESQPSGRLYHERWKVKSPILRGVIMLATTLICLEVNHELSNDSKSNKKHIALPGDVIHRLIQALQQSRIIWEEQKDLHHDIPRTIQAIDVIFSKLEKKQKDTPYQAVDETSPSNKGPGYDSTTDFFSGSNPSAWPELEGAMFIDQAINFQQLQANNMDSPMSPFTIAPELLDLTNSVDLMMGMSMNYPRTTRF